MVIPLARWARPNALLEAASLAGSGGAALFRLDSLQLLRLASFAKHRPPADPDTGMFDLEAIDAWRRARHQPSALTAHAGTQQATPDGVVGAPASAAERFLAAKRGQTEDRGRCRGAA